MTLAAAAGATLADLMAIAGHSTVSAAMIYNTARRTVARRSPAASPTWPPAPSCPSRPQGGGRRSRSAISLISLDLGAIPLQRVDDLTVEGAVLTLRQFGEPLV
jgi:hypothetical protein